MHDLHMRDEFLQKKALIIDCVFNRAQHTEQKTNTNTKTEAQTTQSKYTNNTINNNNNNDTRNTTHKQHQKNVPPFPFDTFRTYNIPHTMEYNTRKLTNKYQQKHNGENTNTNTICHTFNFKRDFDVVISAPIARYAFNRTD